MECSLGCFNRPWREFSYEEALKGIAEAGFEYTGFLGHVGSTGKPVRLISDKTEPGEVDNLVKKVKQYGLTPLTVIGQPSRPLIDNVKRAGMKYLLTSGGYREELKDLADYAAGQGVTIMIKPHGGPSPSGKDCLEVVKKVDSPAFKICYDPGNVMNHTDINPAKEIEEIADQVVGICIKDYKDGSVAATPGSGEVDFEAIFRTLSRVGFSGPAIVETLAWGDSRLHGGDPQRSGTISQVNQEAKRAYNYLAKLLVST